MDTNILDDGTVLADDWGDNCDDYAANTHWCGSYNNDAFKSDEMCCACDGGEWVIPGEDGDEQPDEEELMCFDTNFDSAGNVLTDNWADGCEQYNAHPGWCGNYNNDDF